MVAARQGYQQTVKTLMDHGARWADSLCVHRSRLLADPGLMEMGRRIRIARCFAANTNYGFTCKRHEVPLKWRSLLLNVLDCCLEEHCTKCTMSVPISSRVSPRLDVLDSSGRTALHLAAESGHGVLCETLLGRPALLNARCSAGRTALHQAAGRGFSGLVESLIQRHGAAADIAAQVRAGGRSF